MATAEGVARRLRVVRAESVPKNPSRSMMERLSVVLEDWADWSRRYHTRCGYERASLCGEVPLSKDFESMCAQSDSVKNAAVDAAVDSLPPAQGAAIMRCYGLAAVFRFPRANYAEQLDLAHGTLMKTLPRRGVDLDY